MTFRSRRPFDVERFQKLCAVMESRAELPVKSESARGTTTTETQEDDPPPRSTEAGRKAALRVVRAKGLLWLANQQSHWQLANASLAGRRFDVHFTGTPWDASIDQSRGRMNSSEAAGTEKEGTVWQEPWGDRRTELVVIGQDMDHAGMNAALEACVVTEEEMVAYAQTMPKSYDTLSAHSCIAVFQRITNAPDGGNADGASLPASLPLRIQERIAQFHIERYLSYVHACPARASGLVKEFDMLLGATPILTDQTASDALSSAVEELKYGDKVSLQWLQVRSEMEATNEDDRYRTILHCIQLVKLDAYDERGLLQQFSEPQITIPPHSTDPAGLKDALLSAGPTVTSDTAATASTGNFMSLEEILVATAGESVIDIFGNWE